LVKVKTLPLYAVQPSKTQKNKHAQCNATAVSKRKKKEKEKNKKNPPRGGITLPPGGIYWYTFPQQSAAYTIGGMMIV